MSPVRRRGPRRAFDEAGRWPAKGQNGSGTQAFALGWYEPGLWPGGQGSMRSPEPEPENMWVMTSGLSPRSRRRKGPRAAQRRLEGPTGAWARAAQASLRDATPGGTAPPWAEATRLPSDHRYAMCAAPLGRESAAPRAVEWNPGQAPECARLPMRLGRSLALPVRWRGPCYYMLPLQGGRVPRFARSSGIGGGVRVRPFGRMTSLPPFGKL